MFAVLTVNLGSWFDNHSGTVSASEPTDIPEEQSNNTASSGQNIDNTGLEYENNGLGTENDTDKVEIENSQDNSNTDNYIDKDEQKK